MTEIHDDLRDAMKQARIHPVQWGKPRGLTYREIAAHSKVSEIWARQLIEGHRLSASPNAIGALCFTLQIKSAWLSRQGYKDVAVVVSEFEKHG
jgi:hypothetical protein